MDLADLGIRVRSEDVAIADERLDDLTASAMRAENATEQLGAASRASGAGVNSMTLAVRQQNMVMAASRTSMGLTAAEGLNLSRQFADIGVTAAMGMNPLMIALQQGPQLLDIFQMAAARAGTSISTVLRGVAASAWAAVAPFAPLIAAVGAAAALIGGTLALATRSLNDQFGDLTRGMGLTEDQLEKVKNKGVTMGDVVGGTLGYLSDIIMDKVGPAVTAIGEWFSDAMDVATRALMAGTRFIVGSFIGSYRAITGVWSQLPAVMGDVSVSAANATIRAVEGMINGAVAGINVVIGAAKALAIINPAFAAANGMAFLSPVNLAEMANANSGAARAAGRSIGADFAAGFAEATPFLDRQAAAWTNRVAGEGRDRILGEAGDAGGGRSGGNDAAGRARDLREELTKIEKIDIRPLTTRMEELMDPLDRAADRLALINDLARDTARGLSSAFGQAGYAMGDLLTVTTEYQQRLNSIDRMRRDGLINDQEKALALQQAEIQNYGDMAAAARGFFTEGSDGYRAMLAIEQVYRAFQLAGMIQAMVMGQQETASSVANSMTKGAASAAAGAAKIFEMLGPWAFPVVAGMLALLGGLGLGGGGGGKGGPSRSNGDADSPDASTANVRALGARDAAARDSATSAIAGKIDVRVSADKDGIHAYVVTTARGEAVRVAAPMAVAAAGGAKRDTLATLQDQQAGNRRIMT